jgi:hypothetical protein
MMTNHIMHPSARLLLALIVMIAFSFLKPKLYSHQYNLMYPISFIVENTSYYFSTRSFYSIEDFLPLIGGIPYFLVLTFLNIAFGVLDGAIFHYGLNLSLNASIITIFLFSLSVNTVVAVSSVLSCELRDFSLILQRFYASSLFTVEDVVTHSTGTLLLYHWFSAN